MQGDHEHALLRRLHVVPEKPAAHEQVKELISSVHSAPFKQCEDPHSLSSVSQVRPLKPQADTREVVRLVRTGGAPAPAK